MSEQTTQAQEFKITLQEPMEAGGPFIFAVGPKNVGGKDNGSTLARVRQYIVAARHDPTGLTFDWSGSPDEPGAARADIEADIRERMKDREEWIGRVNSLVGQVERWAKEEGWSTRRIEKRLEDAWIGLHQVPALLMQRELCRVLLEPLGLLARGSEGVVDLYLMPAYDDIARIVYRGDAWSVRYLYPDAAGAAGDGEEKPITKEMFLAILAEFQQHAV